MKSTLTIAAFLLGSITASSQEERTSWTVFADTVYTSDGDAISNGVIRVEDGKIVGVGSGRKPGGDDALVVAAITPGMIDASVRIHTGISSVEQSSERVANMRVADALDLFDERWQSVAETGVTAAFVSPPDRAVLGGLGLVLKTAGPYSVAGRTVKADAALRGAVGSEPSAGNRIGRPTDFYVRRPTTRMGVEWELRKAFYDAAYARGDDERAFEGADDLRAVLDGDIPITIQAWATQDIRTSVFWKEEMQREGFGNPRLIIDAGAEAWKEPDLLVRSGTAVILPPYPGGQRARDNSFMSLDCAKVLHDLGVPIALSAHGVSTVGSDLGCQAGFAIRGGLSFDDALAAVTTAPARLLGVEDRVGSIQVGRDADLVLWSGTPFEFTSHVIGVLIDGELILDPRKDH